MQSRAVYSGLQFEKQRTSARLHLTSGETQDGCCFLAGGSIRGDGPERIGDLLNAVEGFLPFEVLTASGPRTTLVNPAHIIMVALSENEASLDPGHLVARAQSASLLLSNGQRVAGLVRVHQPEGHDRLSDWTRQGGLFRYVETAEGTLLINAAHIVHLTEAEL
jgi:hypothetical protein